MDEAPDTEVELKRCLDLRVEPVIGQSGVSRVLVERACECARKVALVGAYQSAAALNAIDLLRRHQGQETRLIVRVACPHPIINCMDIAAESLATDLLGVTPGCHVCQARLASLVRKALRTAQDTAAVERLMRRIDGLRAQTRSVLLDDLAVSHDISQRRARLIADNGLARAASLVAAWQLDEAQAILRALEDGPAVADPSYTRLRNAVAEKLMRLGECRSLLGELARVGDRYDDDDADIGTVPPPPDLGVLAAGDWPPDVAREIARIDGDLQAQATRWLARIVAQPAATWPRFADRLRRERDYWMPAQGPGAHLPATAKVLAGGPDELRAILRVSLAEGSWDNLRRFREDSLPPLRQAFGPWLEPTLAEVEDLHTRIAEVEAGRRSTTQPPPVAELPGPMSERWGRLGRTVRDLLETHNEAIQRLVALQDGLRRGEPIRDPSGHEAVAHFAWFDELVAQSSRLVLEDQFQRLIQEGRLADAEELELPSDLQAQLEAIRKGHRAVDELQADFEGAVTLKALVTWADTLTGVRDGMGAARLALSAPDEARSGALSAQFASRVQRVMAEELAALRKRLLDARDRYVYDVALSFAGEYRDYVEKVSRLLEAHGVRHFYDRLEEAKRWGQPIRPYLDRVYHTDARFCVVFISREYVQKTLTRYELDRALARARASEDDYILPAYFDDTEVPELAHLTHINLQITTPDELVQKVNEKLNQARQREAESGVTAGLGGVVATAARSLEALKTAWARLRPLLSAPDTSRLDDEVIGMDALLDAYTRLQAGDVGGLEILLAERALAWRDEYEYAVHLGALRREAAVFRARIARAIDVWVRYLKDHGAGGLLARDLREIALKVIVAGDRAALLFVATMLRDPWKSLLEAFRRAVDPDSALPAVVALVDTLKSTDDAGVRHVVLDAALRRWEQSDPARAYRLWHEARRLEVQRPPALHLDAVIDALTARVAAVREWPAGTDVAGDAAPSRAAELKILERQLAELPETEREQPRALALHAPLARLRELWADAERVRLEELPALRVFDDRPQRVIERLGSALATLPSLAEMPGLAPLRTELLELQTFWLEIAKESGWAALVARARGETLADLTVVRGLYEQFLERAGHHQGPRAFLRARFVAGLSGDPEHAFGPMFALVRDHPRVLDTPEEVATLLWHMEANWAGTLEATRRLREVTSRRPAPDATLIARLGDGTAGPSERALAQQYVSPDDLRSVVSDLLALRPFLTPQARDEFNRARSNVQQEGGFIQTVEALEAKRPA